MRQTLALDVVWLSWVQRLNQKKQRLCGLGSTVTTKTQTLFFMSLGYGSQLANYDAYRAVLGLPEGVDHALLFLDQQVRYFLVEPDEKVVSEVFSLLSLDAAAELVVCATWHKEVFERVFRFSASPEPVYRFDVSRGPFEGFRFYLHIFKNAVLKTEPRNAGAPPGRAIMFEHVTQLRLRATTLKKTSEANEATEGSATGEREATAITN